MIKKYVAIGILAIFVGSGLLYFNQEKIIEPIISGTIIIVAGIVSMIYGLIKD